MHELLPHDAVGQGRLARAAVPDDHDLAAVPGLRAFAQGGVQVLSIGLCYSLLKSVRTFKRIDNKHELYKWEKN